MLVLLDTTALRADATFSGAVWRALANARPSWDLQIFVPRVVVIETIAGHRRQLTEDLRSFATALGKVERSLRKNGLARDLSDELAQLITEYPDKLTQALVDLNATVLPTPAIPHETLVERAANRTPPCDKNGDGYRDTLNWFTLLKLAVDHPDAEITWVTNNTKDFANDAKDGFHPDLVTELQAINAADRVRLVKELPDLLISIARQSPTPIEGQLKEIEAALKQATITNHITDTLTETLPGMDLDPRSCGLPRATESAHIAELGALDRPVISFSGQIDDEAVAEFELTAEVLIHLDYPPATTLKDLDIDVESSTPQGATAELSKPVIVQGLVVLDNYHRPVDSEIIDIHAKPDDPGLRQWKAHPWRHPGIAIPPELIAQLTKNVVPFQTEWFKQLAEDMKPFPPGYLDQITKSIDLVRYEWLKQVSKDIGSTQSAILGQIADISKVFPTGFLQDRSRSDDDEEAESNDDDDNDQNDEQ